MNSQPTGIKGTHLVRYGTAADQKYLLHDFLNTYDQLVINAKMVAHMPTALASFVTTRAQNKPYFIDPQTYIFQHDIDYLISSGKKGGIKKSICKLLEKYGNPVKSCIEKNTPVLPKDFRTSSIRKNFCEKLYLTMVIDCIPQL